MDTANSSNKILENSNFSVKRESTVDPFLVANMKNDWVVEFPTESDTDMDLSEAINRVETLLLPDDSLHTVQLNESKQEPTKLNESSQPKQTKPVKTMKQEKVSKTKENKSSTKPKPPTKPIKSSTDKNPKLKQPIKEKPSFTLSMLEEIPEKENIAPNTTLDISAIPKQPETTTTRPASAPKKRKVSNTDIHLRLYSAATEKRERNKKWVEEEKRKAEASEVASATFKPQLNSKSIKLANGYTKSANVFERTAQPNESMRKFRDMERYQQSKTVECTFKPELSTKTQKIYLQKVKEGDRTLPLFDSLYMDAKERSMLQESVKEFVAILLTYSYPNFQIDFWKRKRRRTKKYHRNLS